MMICAELSVFNKTLLDQLPKQKLVYNNNANYLNFYLQKNISYLWILSTSIASSITLLKSQMSGLSSDQDRQIIAVLQWVWYILTAVQCSLVPAAVLVLRIKQCLIEIIQQQNLICLMWDSFKKASTLTIKLLK